LAIAAVIATFTWRTGSSLPGALICGLVVTWYVVAGTATQAAFWAKDGLKVHSALAFASAAAVL
jgi:hypothetical protein